MRNFFATVLTALLAGTAHSSDAPNIEWPAYGGSAGGGHYSAATEITPENTSARHNPFRSNPNLYISWA